jgi:hypothetical protein
MLNSCKKVVELYGKQYDTIKFSTTDLKFDSKGGSAVITSEGWHWNINRYVEFPESGTVKCSYEDTLYLFHILKMESSWFVIEKENARKLVFSVQPNNTGEYRSLVLEISERNYFPIITLTQSAD